MTKQLTYLLLISSSYSLCYSMDSVVTALIIKLDAQEPLFEAVDGGENEKVEELGLILTAW